MLRSIVVLLVLTLCCWSMLGAACKCDQKVIDLIKEKFWNHGHCTPKDILRKSLFWKTEIIARTSEGYYPEEAHITCAYTSCSESVVKLFIKYDDSSSLPNTTSEFNIIEIDGVLIERALGQYRYYLYSNFFGVRAFYKCSDEGKIGAPEGLIEVSRLGYDKEALVQSIKDLESLGIKLSTKTFSDGCAA